MGTNFYVIFRTSSPCPHCGNQTPHDESLHIGKSSGGWEFSFQAHENHGILSWSDWQKFITATRALIEDEYGNRHPLESFTVYVDSSRGKGQRNYTSVTGHGYLDDNGWSFSQSDFS